MAYGAKRPVLFHRAICESQALNLGTTGNYTRAAMAATLGATKYGNSSMDTAATLACLRSLPMDSLLRAQSTPSDDINAQWLPVFDGTHGFLPAAPSALLKEQRFPKVTMMIGWCEDDGTIFTPSTIHTAKDTTDFFRAYLPGFTEQNLSTLLSLYSSSDFSVSIFPNGSIEFSAERYHASHILRDILITCGSVLYGNAVAKAGNTVYLYDHNATLWCPILQYYDMYGYSVIHTSELYFIFGNLSHPVYDWPWHPTSADYQLRNQESRPWSTFTALGKPSLVHYNTLQGWQKANFDNENLDVFIIGGPNTGYSGMGGNISAMTVMKQQQLQARCGFLNSPEIVKELAY